LKFIGAQSFVVLAILLAKTMVKKQDKNIRVNWIDTITIFASWRYTIKIHHIRDMLSEYLSSL
jgi:hypothetical protein